MRHHMEQLSALCFPSTERETVTHCDVLKAACAQITQYACLRLCLFISTQFAVCGSLLEQNAQLRAHLGSGIVLTSSSQSNIRNR